MRGDRNSPRYGMTSKQLQTSKVKVLHPRKETTERRCKALQTMSIMNKIDWKEPLIFAHNKAKVLQTKLSGGSFRTKEYTFFHTRSN